MKRRNLILVFLLLSMTVYSETYFNLGYNIGYNNSFVLEDNFSSCNVGAIFGVQQKNNSNGFHLLGDLQVAAPLFLDTRYSSTSPFYVFQVNGEYKYVIREQLENTVELQFRPFQ